MKTGAKIWITIGLSMAPTLPLAGQSFLLATESFDSYAAGPLTGQGVVGSGWTTGWIGDSDQISAATSPVPLTYQIPGRGVLASSNGCLELTTAPEPIPGTSKSLSRSFTPVKADVFISVVFQLATIGSGTDKLLVDVLDDTDDVLATFEFQPSMDTDFPAYYRSMGGFGRSGVLPDGDSTTTYLALFEIRRNSGTSGAHYLPDYWINPDDYELRGGGAAVGNNDNSISTVRFRIESSDNAGPHTTVRIDNLRVGLTWDSAVPPLPPNTTFPNFFFEAASRLTWFASSDFRYRVESSDNGQSWSLLTSFQRGNNSIREYFVPLSRPVELLRIARRPYP